MRPTGEGIESTGPLRRHGILLLCGCCCLGLLGAIALLADSSGHVRVAIAAAGFGLLAGVLACMQYGRAERILTGLRTRGRELATAEERLRELSTLQGAILESASTAIICADPDGVVRLFNPRAEEMFGWRAAEVIGRMSAQRFLEEREFEQHRLRVEARHGRPARDGWEALGGDGTSDSIPPTEWMAVRKDGSTLPVLVSFSVLRESMGSPRGYLGIAQDISDRVRAETALREANDALERRVLERTAQLEAANEDLRHRNEMLAATASAQSSWVEQGDLRTATRTLLQYAIRRSGSAYGFLGVVLPDRAIRVLAFDGVDWDPAVGLTTYENALRQHAERGYFEFRRGGTLYSAVLEQGRTVIANDAASDARAGGLPPGHPPLHAFFGVPLHGSRGVAGVLGLANRPGGYEEHHEAELRHLLDHAALLCEEYLREETESGLRDDRDRARGALRSAKDVARESGRQSQATLDTLGAHIAIVEADGTISATNAAWRDFADRNGSTWTALSEGRDYLAVCDAASALGCAEAGVVAAGIRSILAGTSTTFELEYPCHSEEDKRWFLCRATRFRGGGPARVAIAHEDITAGKLALLESERRRDLFESLAEDSPIAIFHATGAGSVHFYNRHVERLAGIPLEDIQGGDWVKLIHPDDLPVVREAWEKVMQGGESIQIEIRIVRDNGAPRWAVIRAAPLHTQSDAGAAAVGTAIDVTERKRMEGCLLAVSGELSRVEGPAFYRAAVARVAEALDVEVALVAVPVDEPATRARTIAVSIDGRPAENFEYELAATPCAAVFCREVRVHPRGLRESFPDDATAAQLGAEAYACIPLCDPQGHVLGILAAVSRRPFADPEQFPALLHVFAARLAAEIDREKREKSFRDLFEFAPDALVLSDRGGRVIRANQSAAKLLQYPGEELQGLPPDDLLPEEFRRRHVELREAFFADSGAREMGSRRSDLYARRRDGTVFPVEISLSPLEIDSQLVVAAAIRDVTDRRRMEAIADRQRRGAELRAEIAEAFATEPTLEAAVRSTVAATGRALELDRVVVWSLGPGGRLVKLGAADAGAAPDVAETEAPAEVVRCAADRRPLDWNAGADDAAPDDPAHLAGRGFTSFAGYPLMLEDRAIGVLAVYRRGPSAEHLAEDLAIVAAVIASNLARRRAEADLRALAEDLERRVEQRTAALEAANAELDAFSASVSHDLRAPLRRIRGFASILSERAAATMGPEEVQWTSAIERSSEELSSLIRDLLTAARATRAELSEERVDLSALASRTMATLCADCPERRIAFDLGSIPEVVGDPTLLEQALVNILGNAVKYTRDREAASVEMGTAGLSPEGRVVVFVRDNGIGFDMKKASGLFGMFRRFHDAGEFEGTGIGLATVKRIVERHGGRVWAESEPGVGSTFYFTLAAARSA